MSDENKNPNERSDEEGQEAPEGYQAEEGAIEEKPQEKREEKSAPPPPPPPYSAGQGDWGAPKPRPENVQQPQRPQHPPRPAPPQARPGQGVYNQPPQSQGYAPQQQGGGYGGPPPPPQGDYRPPQPPGGYGGYPRPPRPRNRMLPIIAGLVILFLVLAGGLVILMSGSGRGASASSIGSFNFMGKRIGILEVEGVIGEGPSYAANTKTLVDAVKRWKDSESIAAVVVRVNSPGGAVSATQDLYQALNEFRASGSNGQTRPVVVSMGDIAASGGYYSAMAADKVFANEGSLTGSIGVIMSFTNYEGLQDKIGISSRVVKSGEFKDIGSGTRAMKPEEKKLLQGTIDDVYDQFFDAVVEGREQRVRELLDPANPDTVTDDEVRAHLEEYCDGRIFSGRQALEFGMIDKVGSLDDAVKEAAKMANISPDTPTVTMPQRPTGLFSALGGMANKVEASMPHRMEGMARFEYRFAGY